MLPSVEGPVMVRTPLLGSGAQTKPGHRINSGSNGGRAHRRAPAFLER